jgi:hypothetical protein
MNKSTNHYNTIAKGACNPAEGLTLPVWLLDAIGSNTTKHGAMCGTTVGIPIGNFPAFSNSALQSANSLH